MNQTKPCMVRNPFGAANLWDFAPLGAKRFICNAEDVWDGPLGKVVRIPVGAIDINKIENELGDRWIVTVNDREPARGPGFAGSLDRLLAKATSAVLEWAEQSDEFNIDLLNRVEAGARIVRIATEPLFKDNWAAFLEGAGALTEHSLVANALDNVRASGPTNKFARLAWGRPFSEPDLANERRSRALCSILKSDTRVDRDFVKELGDRWVVVVDDHRPSKGSGLITPAHRRVFAEATFAMVETSEQHESIYRALCIGAELGGQIVLVSTEDVFEEDWVELLGQYCPVVTSPDELSQ